MESKGEEIDTMLENHQSKSLNLANDRVTLASSKKELADLRVSLSQSYRLVQEITLQCNDFERAYEERRATRAAELEALNTTITRLSSPAAAAILAGNSSEAAATEEAPAEEAAPSLVHAKRVRATAPLSGKPAAATPAAAKPGAGGAAGG